MEQKSVKHILAERLCCPVHSIRKVKPGSSQHYLVATDSASLFVSILPQRKKIDALRERIRFLQSAGIVVPALLDQFVSERHTILIFERKGGRNLHSQEVSQIHLDQIVELTSHIAELKVTDATNAILQPRIWDFAKLRNTELEKLSTLLLRTKNPLLRQYLKDIHNMLLHMDPTDLIPQQLYLLHGDLHNHNLLFKGNRLNALTDLDDLCLGVPTQDLVRYISCASARLPVYRSSRRYEKMLLNQICAATNYTAKQWRYGFHAQVLRMTRKAIANPSVWRMSRLHAKLERIERLLRAFRASPCE